MPYTNHKFRRSRPGLIGLAALAIAFSLAAVCQAKVHWAVVCNQGDASYGAGTLFAIVDGRGYVATVDHIVRDAPAGPYWVHGPDSEKQPARVVARNQAADVAVLEIDAPTWQPVPLATEPLHGGDLVRFYRNNWGSNRGGLQAARVLSIQPQPGGHTYAIVGATAEQGDSGGGVFDEAGNLVGVVSCGEPGRTAVSVGQAFGDTVAKFASFAETSGVCVGGQCYSPASACATGQCYTPGYAPGRVRVVTPAPPRQTNQIQIATPSNAVAAAPAAVASTPTRSTCQCVEKFASINARLDALEATQTASTSTVERLAAAVETLSDRVAAIETRPGTPGPQGERGPQGPAGPAGIAGQVDVEAIVARVVAQVGDQAAVEPSPARILYYTSTEGCPGCAPVDAKIRALKADGYPITITDLDPVNTVVRGVPRIYIPETGRNVEGVANCEVFLSSVVPR